MNWIDLFSTRQRLAHGLVVSNFRELVEADRQDGELSDIRKAAYAYLAVAIDTLLNYGNRSCRWDSVTGRIRSIFDRHDFAFYSSYAEMATCIQGDGFLWAAAKTRKCIIELSDLLHGKPDKQDDLLSEPELANKTGSIEISCKPGDSLSHIQDASVDAVVMDPPYGANVMYAELSDFFYVG